MRVLILMRHAKSSWGDPGLPDFDRPLNKRGRLSATALGDWMRATGHLPDEAICSAAMRTRETYDRLGLNLVPRATRQLYHAGPARMEAELAAASGQVVLMVGHNPGIGEFADRLVAQAPHHDRFFDYPTGATLVLRFCIPTWSELRPGTGEVLDFVIPRELMG